MRRLWLLLCLCCFSAAHAEEKVEVFATKVDSNETAIHAYGDVVVLYGDRYLSANEVIYDRVEGDLELFGNVTAIEGKDLYALGEYAKMNLAEKERSLAPFYMIEKTSNVWMSCKEAHAKDIEYELQTGMISGCNPNSPLWKIRFSSSEYNSQSKWLDIYNARLYIYEVPIFYFPYFGYSLDTTRRSGLLVPSFGVSSTEGFYYQQPLYVAVSDRWDLELRPQIRTQRGRGLYGSFRFVDSKVSKGAITLGYFKEQSGYATEYDLANKEHYGVTFDYENHNFLNTWFGLDVSGQSGAYADINWMNDIDYVNLAENDETKFATSSQVFSRINLFYNKEQDYIGTYVKYFLDVTESDNDRTIQNLPTLQYHRYLQTYFDDHLLYDLDFNYNNYQRKIGKTARESEIDIPVMLQDSVFDDYINLSYRALLHGRHIAFGGESDVAEAGANYHTGVYTTNSHMFDIGTYLTKRYDEFAHSIAFKATYEKEGSEHRSGYYSSSESVCSVDPDNAICSYYTIADIEETTQLKFDQFLFDGKGEQLLYHRLSQSISHENNDRLGELENELEVRITPAITLYSDLLYDHQNNMITKQLSSLRYNDGIVSASVNHSFVDKLRRGTLKDANYLIADASYRYDRHYRYFAKYAYDIESAVKKNAEIGFLYSKRCWDFGLRYVENNRSVLTKDATNPSSSVYDKYLYFTVMLKPMGGTEFNYKLNDELEGS